MGKNKVDPGTWNIILKVSCKPYCQVPSIFLPSEIDKASGLCVFIPLTIFQLLPVSFIQYLFSTFF